MLKIYDISSILKLLLLFISIRDRFKSSICYNFYIYIYYKLSYKV